MDQEEVPKGRFDGPDSEEAMGGEVEGESFENEEAVSLYGLVNCV